MGFWVYMLRCSDGSYYLGHTDELERRLSEHVTGAGDGYTSIRKPVTVVFAQEFPTREEALARERQLKNWSRAKKEALIAGDWARVNRLCRGRSRT